MNKSAPSQPAPKPYWPSGNQRSTNQTRVARPAPVRGTSVQKKTNAAVEPSVPHQGESKAITAKNEVTKSFKQERKEVSAFEEEDEYDPYAVSEEEQRRI